MLQKTLVSLLILLVANLALAPAALGANVSDKKREFVEKLKANIESQGVGEQSKIKLKLTNGTKIEGYISEINESGFTVVSKKDGKNITVAYPQVKQAKGNNWTAKNVIGIAILTGIFVVLIIAVATSKD
jgi:sRNA-binding regulator protein Hfq